MPKSSCDDFAPAASLTDPKAAMIPKAMAEARLLRAELECVLTNGMGNPAGPRGLTCVQLISPSPETCNGEDDDCNFMVDDNPSDVNQACGSNCPNGIC